MARVFPTLVSASILLLGIMVFAQGAILTYAAYVGESYAIGRVPFAVIGAIGLGAVFGGLSLLSSTGSLKNRLKMQVIGKKVSPEESPNLFGLVRSIASKLGARPPDQIVVGLDPDFFVTSADITVLGETSDAIEGESLFVSTSLARLLSKDEFSDVLGHELGHFRGGDTEYSMKFAPVYAGLVGGIKALSSTEDEGAAGLAKIPAVSILSYMIDVFASNERPIGRERELVADKAGAEVASAQALASALVKLSLYSGFWEHTRSANLERLYQGKVSRNLSLAYSPTCMVKTGQLTLFSTLSTVVP